MAFIAKEGGTTFEPIPEGVHQAVCYGLVDIGSHLNTKFKKTVRECYLMWEFPDLRDTHEKDGETIDVPRIKWKKYTVSLGEKSNLRKDLTSWRGKAFSEDELAGFDLKNVLGVNCMIQIVHELGDKKIYDNVNSIMSLIKGLTPKKPENDILYFSLEDTAEFPPKLPEWIKKQILSCDELKGKDGSASDIAESQHNIGGDDIPF